MNNLDNEVLQDDEDSLTVILLRLVYEQKLQDMIDEGITNGKYEKTSDSNFKDLKSYQSFFYRKVKNHNNGPFIYSDESSSSNEPATLHIPVQTCKFADFKNIATENLAPKYIIVVPEARTISKQYNPWRNTLYRLQITHLLFKTPSILLTAWKTMQLMKINNSSLRRRVVFFSPRPF